MERFFTDLIPKEGNVVVGAGAMAIGTFFQHFYGWNEILETLLYFMVLDYISGVLAAYINPGMALDSQKGFKGILKKICILLLVAVGHLIDYSTGATMTQSIVCWFFIGNEGLSIIENLGKAGLPIPKKLRETLKQLTEHEEGNNNAKG